jgi:hypothetical protein
MDLNQLPDLILSQKWTLGFALVIGVVVRYSKPDVIFPSLDARWRPLLGAGVASLGMLADMLFAGSTWSEAGGRALTALATAILGHVFGIEVLRGGKELPMPGLRKPPPDGGGSTTRIVGRLGIVLLLSGCAGSFEESRGHVRVGVPPELVQRCAALDDQHRTWGAIEKGSAFLAGASGLAVIPVQDETARVALASGAVVAGGTAVVSGFVSQDAAVAWSRECSQ